MAHNLLYQLCDNSFKFSTRKKTPITPGDNWTYSYADRDCCGPGGLNNKQDADLWDTQTGWRLLNRNVFLCIYALIILISNQGHTSDLLLFCVILYFSVLSGVVSMDPSSSHNGFHGRQTNKQIHTFIVLSFNILLSEQGSWQIHLVFQSVFVAAENTEYLNMYPWR